MAVVEVVIAVVVMVMVSVQVGAHEALVWLQCGEGGERVQVAGRAIRCERAR